jgi:RNA polymerase sigma-70 factor (ECF subfamily)
MSRQAHLQRAADRDAQADAERRLVDRLAAGEVEAAAELYDRYASLILGLARRILRNQQDAEEALQDVFSQVWRTAGRFEPARGSLAAWLLVITRARAIDRLRTRQSRPDSARYFDPALMASAAAGPSDQLLSDEQAEQVREALAALPEAQRAALELAYYEGLTQSEIAERLSEPLGTIKTRIRTALLTLRERLGA